MTKPTPNSIEGMLTGHHFEAFAVFFTLMWEDYLLLTRLTRPAIAHGFDGAGLHFFRRVAFGTDGSVDDGAADFLLEFSGALLDVRSAAGAEVVHDTCG